MRILLLLFVVLIASACNQTEFGGEMALTAVPSSQASYPELSVTHVSLQWSRVWECGVDVHVTITNTGTLPAYNFSLSLHDQHAEILELGFGRQHTVVFNITGEQMASWMEASGTIDIDNVIKESDETNNDYRHPLPYSAVPGMESIAICNATKNAPTPTPPHMAPSATYTPPAISSITQLPYPGNETPILLPQLPNLRVVSMQNTYVPTTCWIDNGAGNRHVVWVNIVNDGGVAIEEFTVRFSDDLTTVSQLLEGESRRLEFDNSYGNTLKVELDPFNMIAELNEADNVMERMPLIFTPPPHCTKTPTISPT